MEYFLIEFEAIKIAFTRRTFQLLVKATTFEDAVYRIQHTKKPYYDCTTARNFKNLTIQ